jgi:hypothetical protein
MERAIKGGCLCGKLRYSSVDPPLGVTVCYCSFCQHATGSDRMIEPYFDRAAVTFDTGEPSVFTLPSEGSGKDVHIHFCSDCGTKLALTFARWPDSLGLYVGTLDDPASIPVNGETSKQIFVSEARADTVIFAGIPTYLRHADENDGTPIAPRIPSAAIRADAFRAEALITTNMS